MPKANSLSAARLMSYIYEGSKFQPHKVKALDLPLVVLANNSTKNLAAKLNLHLIILYT